MKNLKSLLVFLLAFAALSISFYNYFYLRNLDSKISSIEKVISTVGTMLEPQNVTDANSEATEPEPSLITFYGTVKKEQIPVELELGDYWYWIYFDEPYLLEQNAAGFPMNVDKMQVYAPADDAATLESLDGKHVEIKGNITWGYAESSVIQIVEIVAK